MEYHNLQTENNYNYPMFNNENHLNEKKNNNYYNIPSQLQDKNDLKESLIPKDTYYEEFKQSSFNYVQPKQTVNYIIKDFEYLNNRNNNYVESKENQINLISNHNTQEINTKPINTSNLIAKNEASSFGNSNNIPTLQTIQMNQASNQTIKIPIVNYSFNGNLSNNLPHNNNTYLNYTNYKPVGSGINNNYPNTTPVNYAVQSQTNSLNNSHNNNNVISYSFTKQNQNVSNISEENSINSVKPQAKMDSSSNNVQNNQSISPNYQLIE